MKNIFVLFLLLIAVNTLTAQIPNQISWQGVLQDSEGNLLDGNYNITVKLFDVATGGTALWTETHTNTPINEGLTNLILGSVTTLNLAFDVQYWLEIQIGTSTPLSRIELTSVPYSLRAKTADAIEGGITETDPTWNGDATQSSNIGRAGNVGIGTTSPLTSFHVYGTELGAGNVLFQGEFKATTSSSYPYLPGSTLLMWYPDRAIFRAGRVSGSQWSYTNSGDHSTAMGFNTIASGNYSVAIGNQSKAYGESAIALGLGTEADGLNATALGTYTIAPSGYETAIGIWNSTYTPASTTAYNTNDRIFSIGIGTSPNERKNALTILKSGKTGIGIDQPTALLHTYGTAAGDGNVLFVGEHKVSTPGIPPASGAGTRMMWYPDKAALRAGYVTGSHWDMNNIGVGSVAMGHNTIASGEMSMVFGSSSIASGYASTAFGITTDASGNVATAFGNNTVASGMRATATGDNTTASGDYAFSMGYNTYAVGHFSVAMGKNTSAHSGYEVVLGSFSTEYTPTNPYGWSENDRLFVIGNGIGDFAPSNAMTVLKSGNVGIGTETPTALLHISGTGTGGGNVLFVGSQKTTPGDPPASGAGTRMMWYPDKAAFRAGNVTDTEWDKTNIGYYSTATGYNPLASGEVSTSIGFWSKATGNYSTAIGDLANATGMSSIALGSATKANAYASTAMGHYNIGGGNAENWVVTDPLFEIGHGTSEQLRKNAVTVLKNGDVGIKTAQPTQRLDIDGRIRIRGGNPAIGKVLTSDADGSATWESPLAETDPTWSGAVNTIGAIGRTGSVGIGISTPETQLHLNSEGLFTGLLFTNEATGTSFNDGLLIGQQYQGDVPANRYSIILNREDSKLIIGTNNNTAGNLVILPNGNIGIGTSSPDALLHVHGTSFSGGNVLFTGEYLDHYISQPPVEGSGTRMMWYPNMAAFRAGRVTSTQWNKSNMGDYSVAFGYDVKASGNSSTALGYITNATYDNSTAMGSNTTASGQSTTALGNNTTAQSAYSVVLGRYNLISGSNNTWVASDPLFVIGNGSSSASRSNAITVLKNGNTGIGTASPSELLHINNSSGTAKLRISSNSSSLSELTFYSGSTYVGAIGSNNTSNYFFIYHGGNIIFKNGRIGIQTETNPTFAIHLPNSTSDGTGKGRGNAWTTYSDKRIKSNTKDIQYGLAEIIQLRPVKYFQHNSTFENGNLILSSEGANDIGLLAQDLYKIIPEIVNMPADENLELWGINYEKLTPVLIKAIQEQQTEIDELKRKLEQLLQQFSEINK